MNLPVDEEGYPCVSHRLYRQHTVTIQNKHNKQQIQYVKDLSKLGRPLDKVIIVDNLKENYSWQKANGINITTWHDDQNDNDLELLAEMLVALA
jgi:TFIIF-interacting CTD phosphatase-like protein